MLWTTFVMIIAAKIVGDAIWHFMQLWLVNMTWYQNLMSKISIKLTKKVMKDFEDEEV